MSAEWPIDPRNPADVLACAGIAHLAWCQDGQAMSGFEHTGDGWRFQVDGNAENIFTPLETAEPAQETEDADGPLILAGLRLDWWCPWGLNADLKTWAGQQTAFSVHRSLMQATAGSSSTAWRTHEATAGGRLYVDVLGSWTSLKTGWSINEHTHVKMLARPWAELLASIGLQAFPMRGGKRAGVCRYSLWAPAPLTGAIAASAGYGSRIYALATYEASTTGRSGSNTVLGPGEPVTDLNS